MVINYGIMYKHKRNDLVLITVDKTVEDAVCLTAVSSSSISNLIISKEKFADKYEYAEDWMRDLSDSQMINDFGGSIC